MTTIAYKNGILAGDKQMNSGTLPTRTTKVRRCGGWICGASGDTARCHEILAWIEKGMDPATLPAYQRDPETCVLVIMVNQEGLYLLENSHLPHRVEEDFYAIGSGRDFALMAMHLGKSAPEAVELASIYDKKTGLGVDTLTIQQPLDAWCIRYLSDKPAAGERLQKQFLQEPGNLVPGRA